MSPLTAAAGEALVINARVDVFVRPRPAGAGDAIEDAVERARRYLEAGADRCYPILAPLAALPGLVADIGGPVNAMCWPGGRRWPTWRRPGWPGSPSAARCTSAPPRNWLPPRAPCTPSLLK